MSYVLVIPARYGSSRLPGKPLLPLGGKPMILRVLERARLSGAQRVVVATDDVRIQEVVQQAGGEALMTSSEHASGTDRLQEVAAQLQLPDDVVIVNVQGDEPLMPPSVIEQVANNLITNPQCGMATLCEPIHSRAELFNPNIVKTVFADSGQALYFSRAPIPWHRDAFALENANAEELPSGRWWRHIGIYAYRVSFLHQFVSWPVAELERIEALEQLRAMQHGVFIHVAQAAEKIPGGVDTEADWQRVASLFETPDHS